MEQYLAYILGGKGHHICEDEEYKTVYQTKGGKIMGNKPFISIIMPVYNAERYLKNIFQDLLKQTYENWELIIVNDCSKDNSAKICDEYSQKDSRVQVLHLDKNCGAGIARNHGIDAAVGEYITFLDADDQIEPVLYERVTNILKKDKMDVVCWGVLEEYYNKNDELVSNNKLTLPCKICRNKREVEQNIIYLEEKTLLGYQWNKVYKSDLLKKYHIRFENTILYEDYFFNIEVMKYAESLYILDEAFYHYKKRFNDSITTKYIPEYFELSYRRVQVMNDLCNEWNIAPVVKNSILGQIYLRYVLSALMRNSDSRSGMNKKEQLRWMKGVAEDRLYIEIASHCHVTNKMLRILRTLINKKKYSICVLLGNFVCILKQKGPLIFSSIKRNK